MDALIWGPHYWFFLHSVAHNYPKYPTSIQKKMHYRLVHHFHEFIPSRTMAAEFVKLVADFPVLPYLDCKDDFVKWMHFIHNKVNERIEKPTMSMEEHIQETKVLYESKPSKMRNYLKNNTFIVSILFILLMGVAIYIYK